MYITICFTAVLFNVYELFKFYLVELSFDGFLAMTNFIKLCYGHPKCRKKVNQMTSR
jgi:hypothetical protein